MAVRRGYRDAPMETHDLWDPLPPLLGTVIRRDDAVTDFSPQDPKCGRRYLVIHVANGRVRVVPLCTAGPGVHIEPGTLKDETVEGYFIRWSADISYEQAAASVDDEHIDPEILAAVRRQWRTEAEKPGPFGGGE